MYALVFNNETKNVQKLHFKNENLPIFVMYKKVPTKNSRDLS